MAIAVVVGTFLVGDWQCPKAGSVAGKGAQVVVVTAKNAGIRPRWEALLGPTQPGWAVRPAQKLPPDVGLSAA